MVLKVGERKELEFISEFKSYDREQNKKLIFSFTKTLKKAQISLTLCKLYCKSGAANVCK